MTPCRLVAVDTHGQPSLWEHFNTDEIPEGEFPELLVAVHSDYGRHADYLNPRYIGRG